MIELGNKVFLSSRMADVIIEFRKAYKRLFDFVEKLNEVANSVLINLSVNNEDEQQLLIACLYQRALTAYQGLVLLAERGMTAEVTILLRSLLEVLFRVGAIAKSKEIAQAYILEDEAHRRKFINKFKLLSAERRASLGNPLLDDLLASINKNIKDRDIKELKTQWFAEKAGLEEFYHSAYSIFSGTVHVNVRDLESILVTDENGKVTSLNYGPNDREFNNLILTAAESLIFTIHAVLSVFKIEEKTIVDDIHQEFIQLHEELQS